MSRKASIVLSAAVVGMLFACTRSSGDASTFGDAGSDGAYLRDPRYSFLPADAVRMCARAEDCVIVPALGNCGSCCGEGAVARGEGEQAYSAVADACKQSGAPRGSACFLPCAATVPACFEGTCVTLPGGDGGSVGPAGACSSGNATDAGAGAALPEPRASTSCGARVVKSGFEDGLDPSWVVSDASSFQIDRSEPLAGAASLRMAYRQKNATVTIAQPDACAVRIAFTMRTRLLTSGLTLARIVAGDGSWLHVRLDACDLSVAEETLSAGAVGFGGGDARWPVPSDTPVRVILTFDLAAKTITSVVAPVGSPFPEARRSALRGDPSGKGAIRAIELGSAPGVQQSAVGNVWLDDLVID